MTVEKFYVYKTLGIDNKWGALIMSDTMAERLPNLSFGMKIYAQNEKLAITKAKETYDKLHTYDSDKENVRHFVPSALKLFITRVGDISKVDTNIVIKEVVKIAVGMNKEYLKYFMIREKDDIC